MNSVVFPSFGQCSILANFWENKSIKKNRLNYPCVVSSGLPLRLHTAPTTSTETQGKVQHNKVTLKVTQ